MSKPTKRPRRPREALPYPYPISDRNPLSGQPWALPERTLRLLLGHCLAAPEFAEPDNAADVFLARADHFLRYWREHARAHLRRDPAELREIATHAEALAKHLEGLEDDLHNWPWRSLRVPSPADLRAVAEAARSALEVETAMRGRGRRDRGPLLQRQGLINELWAEYPEPLRSVALRGHFLGSLRLVLGARAGDAALRALQAEVKRARQAHEKQEKFRREVLGK